MFTSTIFDETPESRYTHVYFEALDKLTISIADCSDQHDHNIYMNCEGLLLKTAIGEGTIPEFDTIVMDPILINYVCELFLVQGFGKNHHDNVYDWIDLQRKECMKEVIIISAEMLRIYISK